MTLISPAHATALESVMDASCVISEPEALAKYAIHGVAPGSAAKPRSAQEAAEIVRFARQSATFEGYKRRELSDKDVHDLAIRFWDAGALGALEIPRLIKEWREPRHPEFVQMGKTAWHLFNSVTETIKGDLWRLPARTRAIHTILDKECGLERNGNGAPDEPSEIVEVTA